MQERTLHNARGIPLRVINAGISSCPPLESLHAGMQNESALLSTTVESLQSSYDAGLGIALTTKSGEAVGFLRFSQLLGAEQKDKLGLPEDFPDVLEVGSAFIHPNYRGGLYAQFRSAALELILDNIHENKTFVLGTTKTIKVLETNPHAEELGIHFEEMVHTDLDGIAVLTCICEGDFGSGRQFGYECPRRVTRSQLANIHSIAAEKDGEIPCTMYVSSGPLARRMNSQILERFGSFENWINALQRIGYYD